MAVRPTSINEGNLFGADLPDLAPDLTIEDNPSTASPGAGDSPAGVSLFYPTELKSADKGSSQFQHWIKFNSYKIGAEATEDVISKIKDKINSIKSIDDVASILRTAGERPGVFDKAIGLYVPSQAVNKIGVHYKIEALGMWENMFGAANEVLAGGLNSLGSGDLTAAISALASAGLQSLLPANSAFKSIPDIIAKKTGVAINPRRTTLFEYPNLREFSFNFIFSPRDPSEENTVNEIVKYFKASSLPNVFGLGAFLNYPNEFELTCMKGATENRSLFKTKRCVIREVDVNYTPSNLFNAFPTGTPTQMIMTLNMLETDILTSADIESGVAY